jgi:hypothetical protein
MKKVGRNAVVGASERWRGSLPDGDERGRPVGERQGSARPTSRKSRTVGHPPAGFLNSGERTGGPPFRGQPLLCVFPRLPMQSLW